MAAIRQAKTKNQSKRTVRYEKGQKIRGMLLLDTTPTRSRRNRENFVNILITATL